MYLDLYIFQQASLLGFSYFLEATGTMDKVREREHDNSGYTNIDDIDWARL